MNSLPPSTGLGCFSTTQPRGCTPDSPHVWGESEAKWALEPWASPPGVQCRQKPWPAASQFQLGNGSWQHASTPRPRPSQRKKEAAAAGSHPRTSKPLREDRGGKMWIKNKIQRRLSRKWSTERNKLISEWGGYCDRYWAKVRKGRREKFKEWLRKGEIDEKGGDLMSVILWLPSSNIQERSVSMQS